MMPNISLKYQIFVQLQENQNFTFESELRLRRNNVTHGSVSAQLAVYRVAQKKAPLNIL